MLRRWTDIEGLVAILSALALVGIGVAVAWTAAPH